MALSDPDVRRRVEAVEALLARIEELPRESRALALDAVGVLVELYGEALERLLARGEASGGDLVEFAARDELVSHLLFLHGLHPQRLEDRVRAAIEQTRPHLASLGSEVALVRIEGARVRLRLGGSAAAPEAVRAAVEAAIRDRAPEIEAVELVNPNVLEV